MNNKQILSIFALILLFLNITFVSAITGAIGNGRMILRPIVGETIEKSILVKNVNDVGVDIELSASGDLEKDIELIDKEFHLDAGKEKKAYFRIKIKEKGSTESQINVKFIPEEGSGVGLSSTIIIISGGEVEIDDDTDEYNDLEEYDDSEDSVDDTADDENSLRGYITGNVVGGENKKNSIFVAVGLITMFLLSFLILSLLFRLKKTKNGIQIINEDNKVKDGRIKTKSKKDVKQSD